MKTKIKSVSPKQGDAGKYEFAVAFEVGDQAGTVSVTAETLLDEHKFRIAVAHETGCLLPRVRDWDSALSDAMGKTEPKPPKESLEAIAE